MMNATINIQSIKKETEKAFLINFENNSTGWLPKSQTSYEVENLAETVTIPIWLANKLVTSHNILKIDF